ncbi:MAG TPA: phospholipase [Anaeromyxobacteraceae bacterium]|nr:phospholipase [Anaeromyxobacteraceae bacterium]
MTLEHRVRRPAGGAARPPLVVLLHGLGADEDDLLGIAPGLDPRFLVVSARAPHPAEPMGYAWYAVDWSREPPRFDEAQALASRERLVGFVAEACHAYGADPARVWLCGFSQGASMALGAALSRPEILRGVVAHSGRLLPAFLPARPPAALRGFPVLWQHGRLDPVVPFAFGLEAERLLPPLGVRLDFREYPIGHEIGEESLGDLSRWLADRLSEVGSP